MCSFPSNFTPSNALNACSSLKCIALGKQLHAFIIKYRTSTTPALGMLFVVCTRNLAAWNLRPKPFERQEKKMKFDLFTCQVETACSRLAALEEGEQIHAQTINSVVIRCSCRNCTWDIWVQLFEDMRQAGFRPNQIPFVGLLAACSHAGMVDRALEYFELMQKEYKIKPSCKLLNDLADKANSLGYKLVENMDVIDVRKRKPERTFSSSVYKYEVGSSIWIIEYACWYSYTDHQKYTVQLWP
ncbi:hypothetical protein SADUNF_Sadunf02G0091300 [Salix dunnii]|uniref:Pentatricopeptide repeat-containing protein n=1 Tax=Salix dunnii TaxID=1413687 RepID=A0A835N6W2_9ROSI|nr:hypothetical protein SADUNF_Sadunf02G0091300 [Salix dunnii]